MAARARSVDTRNERARHFCRGRRASGHEPSRGNGDGRRRHCHRRDPGVFKDRMTQVMNLEWLCRLPLFQSVPQKDLDWLFGMAEEVQVAAGEVLMREGEPGGSLYIVLEGEFEFTKQGATGEITIA